MKPPAKWKYRIASYHSVDEHDIEWNATLDVDVRGVIITAVFLVLLAVLL